jgi:hypothetical protein
VTILQLFLLLALPSLTALRLGSILFGQAEPWRRRFAVICLIVPIIYFPMLVLSTPRLLTPWPVILTHAVILLAVVLIRKPHREEIEVIEEVQPAKLSIGTRLAAFVVSVPLVLVMVKHVDRLFARGSLFFSDDFAYHGFTVSGWFQSRALEHPLITIAHYYPYNPHTLSFHVSLMSPDHQWVWIASLYWLFLIVAAFLTLGRLVGEKALVPFAAAGALFVTSGTVAWVAEKHSPTDLAGAAALLAAFALAMPRARAPQSERLTAVLLSGILAGFAVGSKVTNVVPVTVLLVATFFLQAGASAPRQWMDALKGTVLFALGAFSTAFYWYLRNMVLSGNPLFPVRIFGYKGPVPKDRLEPTILWTYLKESPLDPNLWGAIFRGLLYWPYVLGVLAFLGLIAGGVLLLFAVLRTAMKKSIHPLATPLPWLIAAGFAMLAVHFKAPFSGSTMGGLVIDPFARYIMFVFAVGLAAAAWTLGNVARSGITQLIIALITLVLVPLLWGWYRENVAELPAILLSLLFVVVVLSPLMPWSPVEMPKPARRSCLSRLVIPMALIALLFGIIIRPLYVPGPHPMVDPHPHVVPFEPTRVAIDALPPGSRIAQLSSRLWEHWALYGMHSQHHPVLLHKNGWPLMDLHVAYQLQYTGGGHLHPRFGVTEPVTPERPELLGMNLKVARLDYIVFSGFSFVDEPVWPPHHALFKELPGWQLIWTDGYSEIYAPEGKHPPGFVLDAPHNLLIKEAPSQAGTDESPTITDEEATDAADQTPDELTATPTPEPSALNPDS